MGQKARAFVPSWPLKPSIMFANNSRSLPKRVTLLRCSALIGSSLTRKHKKRLLRLTRDKHSSSFGPDVSCNEENVLWMGFLVSNSKPGQSFIDAHFWKWLMPRGWGAKFFFKADTFANFYFSLAKCKQDKVTYCEAINSIFHSPRTEKVLGFCNLGQML